MTTLTVAPYRIPAATLGPDNPLPAFRATELDSKVDFAANRIPTEDQPGMGWQTGFRVLPYRIQDNYNRVRQPSELFSVVLENDHLRVTVLPPIGGLVTEILHKASGKQLIAKNTILQPGNLALRNAWVYGGIEWNTAQLGHHYLTMSPFHTARITGSQGEPALRLYAWDRVKCFPYQIDLHLPPDSRFLFARIRLINPHDRVLPMYWWTNMGVDEFVGRRYVAPATTAFKFTQLVDIPVLDGVDHSYPTRVDYSYDLFCRIPAADRKWLAVVDPDGTGLVHTSTARLVGRKLFAWGTGPGGCRWQEQLCGPGQRFFEVQAGLARTQFHSLPMPAGAQWTWTEAFGHLAADPAKVHGEWASAGQEIGRVLESSLPTAELDRLDGEFAKVTATAPAEILYRGMGWAALEKQRAARQGERATLPAELPYTAADLGPAQQPWLELLEHGALPLSAPDQDPGEYMIQPEWQALLQASIGSGKGDHWRSWLHLGVMRLEAADEAGAEDAWSRSIQLAPNGWAYRNLAVLALRHQDRETALACFTKAWEIGPQLTPLALEMIPVLNDLARWDDLRSFLSALPADISSHERIQLELCKQALRDGELDTLERLLDRDYDGIREGETILSDLWFGMHEKRLAAAESIPVDDALKARVRRECPPPARIDFRMWTREANKYTAPQAVPEDPKP
jgi:tetratricopeptide (TPR) repeat protein